MIDPRSALPKLPNYIRRFGIWRGLRLCCAVEQIPRQPIRFYDISLPNMQAPIRLRSTRSDRATFWQCMVDAQYDIDRFRQTHRLDDSYRAMVAGGGRPLIIDCGANIGLASLWLARRFPEAEIVAIEPDLENFELLRRNLNHLAQRVSFKLGGVWNASGHLTISNPSAGSAAFRVQASASDSPGATRAYTIDEICSEYNVAAPFVIKIDIEGAQDKLFRGNTDWLKKTHLLMLELDDWQFPWKGTSRSFFSTISQIPYEYLIRGESIFCFRDFQT
jgi:FkbM family methyltransferase